LNNIDLSSESGQKGDFCGCEVFENEMHNLSAKDRNALKRMKKALKRIWIFS